MTPLWTRHDDKRSRGHRDDIWQGWLWYDASLGVERTVKRELRKLHTTFGGFGLIHLHMEQLICRINVLLQHYHTSTALSKKLDASSRYLQLQRGTPYNPLTLPFKKWGYLAPLSWVKMLWWSLDKFNIQLHMKYPMLPFLQEKDQVIMEIILDSVSSTAEIQSLSRCGGMLQCIFLSDLVTANGRYLESFVFDPGPIKRHSNYCFPRECSTKRLGHMVQLLAQLRNYGQQTESFAWMINTSNMQEMVVVHLPNWWSTQNWGWICIPLSAITVHMPHTLRFGIHPHMERAA